MFENQFFLDALEASGENPAWEREREIASLFPLPVRKCLQQHYWTVRRSWGRRKERLITKRSRQETKTLITVSVG